MQCSGFNKSGARCNRKTTNLYCYQHAAQKKESNDVNEICEICEKLNEVKINDIPKTLETSQSFDVIQYLRPVENALNEADPNTLQIAQRTYDRLYVVNKDYAKLYILTLFDYLNYILSGETDSEIDYLIEELLTKLKYT
jgi:hypothetical protein